MESFAQLSVVQLLATIPYADGSDRGVLGDCPKVDDAEEPVQG